MSSKRRFEDLTVIVTGAAGAIGRATANGFLGEDAHVVAADREAGALAEFDDGRVTAVPGRMAKLSLP